MTNNMLRTAQRLIAKILGVKTQKIPLLCLMLEYPLENQIKAQQEAIIEIDRALKKIFKLTSNEEFNVILSPQREKISLENLTLDKKTLKKCVVMTGKYKQDWVWGKSRNEINMMVKKMMPTEKYPYLIICASNLELTRKND